MTKNDEPISISRHDMRAIRDTRKTALIDFVTALGYDPRRLRSLTVDDQKITLHLFVFDENGDKLDIQTVEDGRNPMQVEIGLLYKQTDLDADEKAAAEGQKFADFLQGKPSDRDAFGQPIG